MKPRRRSPSQGPLRKEGAEGWPAQNDEPLLRHFTTWIYGGGAMIIVALAYAAWIKNDQRMERIDALIQENRTAIDEHRQDIDRNSAWAQPLINGYPDIEKRIAETKERIRKLSLADQTRDRQIHILAHDVGMLKKAEEKRSAVSPILSRELNRQVQKHKWLEDDEIPEPTGF